MKNGELKLISEKDLQSFDAAERENGEMIEALTSDSGELKEFIQTNDARKNAAITQREGHEALKKGAIDEALALYIKSAEIFPLSGMPELIERVRSTWSIKSPEHQGARDFIYKKWSQATAANFAALVPEAERSLKILKQHKDDLSARKLRFGSAAILRQLAETIEESGDGAANTKKANEEAAGVEQCERPTGSLAQRHDQFY